MIIYTDTEKEKTFSDYIPLPALRGLSVAELTELLNNLQDMEYNAFCWHSDLLQLAITGDIQKVKMYLKIAKLLEGKRQ